MTVDHQTQLDTERLNISEATQRLITGQPQRTDGKLTVINLAAEAGLSRQRLYEHHPDLVTQFKTASGGGPITPSTHALQQQLAEARDKIQHLEQDNTALQDRIRTLCAVITELTQEAQSDNVIQISNLRKQRNHDTN